MTISRRTSSSITASFFSYEDITLKLFMAISESGNFKLVIKSGIATDSQCVAMWEKIVQDNNKVTGNQEYNSYLKSWRNYNRLLHEHISVRPNLVILCYALDFEAIKYVRSKGYLIDTTNSKTYADSLYRAIRKCDNLQTKIAMQLNDLERTQATTPRRSENFEALMAALSLELGYTVPDEITLARYNEYSKLIERRHHAYKAQREKLNGRAHP